ncbi:hypothetical protein ACSVHC_23390 [Arthrobacter sp. KNU-44]|uniref:hypothetical protein n=1 Tax=Arthrobacter sp. KNU-44 TaxID=3450744 RepID=UPI003F4434FE
MPPRHLDVAPLGPILGLQPDSPESGEGFESAALAALADEANAHGTDTIYNVERRLSVGQIKKSQVGSANATHWLTFQVLVPN